MFGIKYTVVCPRCRTAYETDHGITKYYKISGRGNNQDYCRETCLNCNLEFFHLGGDELYETPLEDIAIPVSDVKAEDVRWSTTICW